MGVSLINSSSIDQLNSVYTDLVLTLSSSNAIEPQHRFITKLYNSGSITPFVVLKNYSNISGTTNVSINRPLQDQFGCNLLQKNIGINSSNNVKYFILEYGEEYSPTINGDITEYINTSSVEFSLFPSIRDINENPNFPISEFISTSSVKLLSDSPSNKLIDNQDYETISYLTNVNGVNVESFDVTIYLSSNTLITSSFNLTSSINTKGDIVIIGSGPKNLSELSVDLSNTFNQDWTHYEIYPIYNSGSSEIITYTNSNNCQDKTRFSFINKYGEWDYYNIYSPLRQTEKISKKSFTRPFVRYEDTIYNYNIENRGKTNYVTSYDNELEIDTQYIDKEESQWLRQLLESSRVLVQIGDLWYNVNITSSQYIVNNSTSRNKLFKYTIKFKYNNQKYSR